MMDIHKEKLMAKVENMAVTYEKYRLIPLDEIACDMWETDDHTLRSEPGNEAAWRPVHIGDPWGKEYGYAWFRGDLTVPASWEGKALWLLSGADATECLLFLNGEPAGLFDYTEEVSQPLTRPHRIQPLTFRAAAGETIHVALEAYAGHKVLGTMPFEDFGHCDNFYPNRWDRHFKGMTVVEIDPLVEHFLTRLRTVCQYYANLEETASKKWALTHDFEELFRLVPQMPEECPPEAWRTALKDACAVLDKALDCRREEPENPLGYAGLVGHSHLDAAWQWPVRETIHKAARTFSNALRVMDAYPEYVFVQSSVAYIDWMRRYYPAIYEGIRRQTAEGRWEPNGGSWIECDGNMTGGECLIRQFVKGQRYLRDNLHYQADAFWQPDTFGYSAAIPQIMKGCGLRYFLTTKLSWNEANTFPYDTFTWKGIDGTEVLTHFNITHCWPDIDAICKNVRENIRQRDVTDCKLIAYGFGDGGGGPSYDMVEAARLAKDLPGIPRSEHTTVSQFMRRLEATAHDLPVYDGELYLELHRGTLTQMHDIKRSNRLAEIALRTLEMAEVLYGLRYAAPIPREETTALYETLLLNQFHDILPGTSLKEVHELAIQENYQVVRDAGRLAGDLLMARGTPGQSLTLFNTLSWSYTRQVTVPYEGLVPAALPYQRFTDRKGAEQLVIGGLDIPPLSTLTIAMTKEKRPMPPSPFRLEGDRLVTPFAEITPDEIGAITSFVDRRCGRQLVKDPHIPLNTLLMGEDIPYLWDNWDIDRTQEMKMQPQRQVLSRCCAADGCLQLRFRTVYALGGHSTLTQDMVVYADSPRVDFETTVDWQDKHHLLKAQFLVDMKTSFSRHEIQYGYVDRPNNANTAVERAKFEVCNHKYTDLFDTRYGVALLNDCKYGISVQGSDMRLTLHKGGCRPDPGGDIGVHDFTYALLPHDSGFSAPSVVRPAYELNMKPLCVPAALEEPEEPPITLEPSNLIVESIKPAEDGNGCVVRFYDSECTTSRAKLRLRLPVRRVAETNMLEDEIAELPLRDGVVERVVKPFEIVTVKLFF